MDYIPLPDPCHHLPVARGYARAGQGNPDESRAARYILKDYVNGKLLYCHPPPEEDPKEFNEETMARQLRRALGRKRAPLTRVGKNADTAPDIFLPLPNSAGGDVDGPQQQQSTKSRALDRDFFESQAMGSRPLMQGGGKSRDGTAIARMKLYPHQNAFADDGTPVSLEQARAAAVMQAGGGVLTGGNGKKHFKMKRGKQRSGKGYD
jgi:large subunit GTPase 1